MDRHALAPFAPVRVKIGRPNLIGIVQSARAAIARRRNAALERRHHLDLLALDDRMLADIGVERWEVELELHSRWHGDRHLERALTGLCGGLSRSTRT
jgi:uncharacterized protein YjiS (DUF1127 family)